MHAVYLRNTDNGHNKHYFVWVAQGWNSGDLSYSVLTAWGKIDADPVSKVMETHSGYTAACIAVDKLANQKRARGYKDCWHSGSLVRLNEIAASWSRRTPPKFVPESFPVGNGTAPIAATSQSPTGRRQPKAQLPLQNVPSPREKKPKEEPERMIRDDAEWNF